MNEFQHLRGYAESQQQEYAANASIKIGSSSLWNNVLSLGNLAFFVFVVYALSVSNTTAVQTACGSSKLWTYVLAHLVAGTAGVIIIILFLCGWLSLMFSVVKEGGGASQITGISGIVFFIYVLAYTCTFLGLGVPIVTSAMNSDECVKALSNASFTNTPLLGILAWIYIAVDALILLVLIGFLCIFCCWWCHINAA